MLQNIYGVLSDKPPTQKQFLVNMEEKLIDREFMEDIHALLRPELSMIMLKKLGEKIGEERINRKNTNLTRVETIVFNPRTREECDSD